MLWQIGTLVGLAGTATLGILYGLAARKAGHLVSQVVLAEAKAAKLADTAARLRGLYVQRERYIATLEKSLIDRMPADQLAGVFNRMLSDGADPNDGETLPSKPPAGKT